MTMDLNFLKDINLTAISKGAPIKAAIVKLPTDAHIRVFANGRVYPSKAFADSMSLEFVPKQVIVEGSKPEVIGNGLDIFSSSNWGMLEGQIPEGVFLLFAYVIPKSFPKVDMWGNTKYDAETGEPKASVFTQGNSTFSRSQLLPMLTEAYGIDWTTVEYVDLILAVDDVMTSSSKMYDIPKIISGGAKKGQLGFQRRQNINIYPLVVQFTKTSGVIESSKEVAKMEVVAEEVKAPVEQVTPFDETVAVPKEFGTDTPIDDPAVFESKEIAPVAPAVLSIPVIPVTTVEAVPVAPIPVQPNVSVGEPNSGTSMAGQDWAKRLAAIPPKAK